MEDIELGKDLTCFIVSPIGDALAPIGSPGRTRYEESLAMWDAVFEPACKQFGLSPVRADRIHESGEIPDQIFTYLRDAEVVIADLSHGNPNVMYELGLRHSRPEKITLQIGEYELLPFDVATIRTIKFRRTEPGLINARNELYEKLRVALRGGGDPLRATRIFADSSRVSLESLAKDVAKSVAQDDLFEDVEAPGTLEILAEGEVAMEHLSEIMGELTEILTEVGTLSTQSVANIEKSDSENRGFAGRLLVAKDLAQKLKIPADTMETKANDYYGDVMRVDVMIRYLLARFQEIGADADADATGTLEFLHNTLELVNSAENAVHGFSEFLEGTKVLRSFSRDLAPVTKVLDRSMNRILEGIEMIGQWRVPTELLIANLLGGTSEP